MELEIILKILLAFLLGGMIGLERELSHKEAGLRTNILIAVSSTLLTIISLKIVQISNLADPGRITAQIVTGIGFLGAGAIIQARFAIQGLTTAATIWTVAAIGIGIGSGYYLISLIVTILVIIILTLLKKFSAILERHRRVHLYVIKMEDRAKVAQEVKKIILELKIEYLNISLIKKKGKFEMDLALNTSENKNKMFMEKLLLLKGIEEISSENL
jgi:putative Mg2+ transporter-C (MgtC) family protein